jgi:hypothetical protein
MIQLSLSRIGVGVEAARIVSISLLIAFTVVLYFSLKMLDRRKESSTSLGGENR